MNSMLGFIMLNNLISKIQPITYTLEEDSIVNQNLFSLAARIDIISKRFQQANLTYDEKKGTISYSEFEETYIEETGEYTYKKRTVSWIFEDGQFVKSSL
jgi:hypothetical protein